MAGYDFKTIEPKWQAYWDEHGTFVQPNPGDEGFDAEKPKFYVLDMFPYPSGAGLHVGHPVGYVATDIIARYKRMRGLNVLHPMGYDAFGLPAQQYAVEHGIHPRVTTERNIDNIERQIKMIGFSYDWSRRLATTDPAYYRWTQWIFCRMFDSWYDPAADAARPISELIDRLESNDYRINFAGEPVTNFYDGMTPFFGEPLGTTKWHELPPEQRREIVDSHRLAYLAEVPVNWCPALGTVLANEEVTNEGRSDRGDHPVYRRPLTQWMLRITAYADRLLEDLDAVDWPEPIKLMQRNWIGKSTGAEVDFPLASVVEQAFEPVPVNLTPNAEFQRIARLPEGTGPTLTARSFEGCDPFPKDQPVCPHAIGTRRNLPHIYLPGATYFVTFRVHRIALGEGEERDEVFRAMLHWHGKRCVVYGCVVLDDHAHIVVRPLEGESLPKIMQSIKGYSARQINLMRQCGDPVWQDENFDHIIRNGESFHKYMYYICQNPVKRGLTKTFDTYPWLFINADEVTTDDGVPLGHSLKGCATAPDWFSDRTEGGFPAAGEDDVIRVYTTRPDTLYGATYMVLAPEHPLVERITTDAQRQAVAAYVAAAARKSELERTAETKQKTGVFTGAYAVNPVNREAVPIWIADYVMTGYGTGAIMAVPAHDTRDLEFAEAFDLPVVQVVAPPDRADWRGYVGDGVAVNSGPYDGLPTAEFVEKITADLEDKGLGRRAVNYRLRDWTFSRQWYWGEPFPIVHCPACGAVALPDDALPLLLPEMEDFRPAASDDPDAPPQPPLGRITEWVQTTCPSCGGPAKRETNAMPQWAGSCWYYLRFCDPKNDKALCGDDAQGYWMGPNGVDLYVGGAEHAVLHLLYARFWHKVLYDLGHVGTPEPFGRLFNQGMIRSFAYRDGRGMCVGYDDVDLSGEAPRHRATGEELTASVEKMSKSLKNVVNPDEVIGRYGADTLRLYEMFMGPLDVSKPWNTRDVPGVHRFCHRVWRMLAGSDDQAALLADAAEEQVERGLHRLVKKVGEDIEAMKFNTAIAAMMEFVNLVYKAGALSRGQAERFVLVLAPFAPHLAEELWEKLGHDASLAREPWPAYDDALLAAETVELAVQVNGKVRGRVSVAADADAEAVLAAALAEPKVADAVEGKQIVKKIVVPHRLVNLVVK